MKQSILVCKISKYLFFFYKYIIFQFIDDLLDSVGVEYKNNRNFLNYSPNQSPAQSRFVNDENVLMKLAQMSHSISKDENLLNSIDFKTGALLPTTTTTTKNTKSTGTDSMQNDLAKQNNSSNIINNLNLSESLIREDLNTFLKSHNIRDGNLVATRRIDLRPGQQQQQQQQQKLVDLNKKPVDLLMESILSTNDDEKYFRNIANQPLRFLNDSELNESSSSSSSSSSSEEDEQEEEKDKSKTKSSLWIERYRAQKMKSLLK